METILLIIVKIILVGLVGVICALFSYLLDYCFWRGSIFENYLPWLSRTLLKHWKPQSFKEAKMVKADLQEGEMIRRAEQIFFFKVLGGCVICTNVWISMASWPIINLLMGIGWFYGFVYILTASFFLRKITGD